MIDDEELWALESLAHFHLMQDRDDDARALLESVAALAPHRAYPWFGLGLLATRMGDAGLAVQCFAGATERSREPRFALALAEAHLATHNADAAAPILRRLSANADRCGRRAAAILRRLR